MATAALPLQGQDSGQLRPVASSLGGFLVGILVAVVAVVAALMLSPRLAAASESVAPTSFSASGYPVRPIQRWAPPRSESRLVRVPCAGRARKIDNCWVAADR